MYYKRLAENSSVTKNQKFKKKKKAQKKKKCMEDEIVLLEALYPLMVKTKNFDDIWTLKLEYVAISGLKGEICVTFDKTYPSKSRPKVQFNKLSIEMEEEVMDKINLAISEFQHDLCLVQIFGTFTMSLDELSARCGICLDDVKEDLYVTNVCSHIFHSNCFSGWKEQCKQNHADSIQAEESRTRRRQKESIAEADVKMALNRVSALQNEHSRLTSRKQILNSKVLELSASSSKTLSNSNRTTTQKERDKNDEDLIDLSEVQRRLVEVGKDLKTKLSEIAGAKKLLKSCENSLNSIKELMSIEAITEETNEKVPCPVCRQIS